MKLRSLLASCALVGCGGAARPVPMHANESVCLSPHGDDGAQPSVAPRVVLHAGKLFDGEAMQSDVELSIEGDRIVALGRGLKVEQPALHIDLHAFTVLPGLIDVHTHALHPGADYLRGLVTKSIPARALDAAAAVRGALLRGFTSLRDVESEGAGYADVDLKRAINAGKVLGPRMWVSTRGLTTTGRYEPFDVSWELELPNGAQVVVGEQQARAAVREQIAHGADWIKLYADFFPLTLDADGHIRGTLNFTDLELQTIVAEAHRQGHKVAAHAISHDGIAQALAAGVDSLEHAHGLSAELAARALAQGVFVVPTLFAESFMLAQMPASLRALFETGYANLARAARMGVKIAYGSDLGSVPWSENAAAGFALYVERLGMTPAQALRAGTVAAAELLGEAGTLGQLRVGALADVIAVRGDPTQDAHALSEVTFVMKGGAVVRAQ